jgi:alpha-1,3/alpha-1,6-mannosyltransferase
VRGDKFFPSSVGGGLSILFAILRQVALVLSTVVFSSELRQLAPDVLIVDQLSACIPLFRLLYPKARILFYGHFPDRLLVKPESGLRKYIKNAYRVPFDAVEDWSTACSDSIVVNSKFTRSVFKKTFPRLRSRELKVVYPCVDTEEEASDMQVPLWPNKKLLLSINRFEGKKNLDLAVKAYAGLTAEERGKAKLVLAGGFDPRNHENDHTYRHLRDLSDSLQLTHATRRDHGSTANDLSDENAEVIFLLSIPHELKVRLLQSASLLLYTPENEHFGIVPLEAMLAGVPVLATNTGGPLETIYDGRTGWLRGPDKVQQWTDVMRKPLIPSSETTLRAMGTRGRERVRAEFSQTKMTEAFDREVQGLIQYSGARPRVFPMWLLPALLFAFVALVGALMALQGAVLRLRGTS